MANHGVQVVCPVASSPIAKWKERGEEMVCLKALHHLLPGSQAMEREARGTRTTAAQRTMRKDLTGTNTRPTDS